MADFTIDPTTPTGRVHCLINDVDPSNPLFTDTIINAFLSLWSGDVFLAAAQAMTALASSTALLARMKMAGNYKEDLCGMANECREAAKMFTDMANNVPAEAQAEVFWTDFSYRDTLRNKSLRNEIN